VDVLLINPPRQTPQRADFPPIGLSYIAAVLKREGISTRIVDASALSWDRLGDVIRNSNPQIIGVACWTVERGQSSNVARLAKSILPHVKIIMGGHHASAFPDHMFSLAYADAVVIGEGEASAPELVKTLLGSGNLDGVKGIAYRADTELILTEPRALIEDIDSIPLPSYEGYDLDAYLGLPETTGRAAAIITSRGCPYRCIFCSASKFWGRKWRARSAQNVLTEIEWLRRDYGISALMFFDDNFTVNKPRAIAICEGIMERGLHLDWAACSHVSQVDKELLGWMSKAGCYRIDYGVESGNPMILSNIRKRQTVEEIEEAFRLTREAGIRPRAYLMVGNPGESKQTIRDTVELMRRVKPYDTSSGQILWVLPDTEIYEMAKSKGIISDEYWLANDSMVYYTGDHSVEQLKVLRDELMRGLARNQRSLKAWANYWMKRAYYSYPSLQKLRSWQKVVCHGE
jgi:radical SAM superfamily enzyme YgiQ (UPF0313 family)